MAIRRYPSFLRMAFLPLFSFPLAGIAQQTMLPSAYAAEIVKERQEYNRQLRTSPFSHLALVYRQYLETATRVSIGSSPTAGVRLEGRDISPVHAVIEGNSLTPTLRAQSQAALSTADNPPRRLTELLLQDGTKFRIGRFHLLYRLNPPWGRTLEVFDPEAPPFREFTGVEFFPVDPAYRISGEIIPQAKPERVVLLDIQGREQPWWLYGELRFRLQATPSRLALYTLTLDPQEIQKEGFMLIFKDPTSGKESFPGARYLYVEGKMAGAVTVDFNRTFNPPCVYSSIYTCAFPRPQNRLAGAIRAGAKWYRKKSS